MWISGHILLNRSGRASIKEMYQKANAALAEGTDIFIFPQGTRERKKVLPFKHGAFSIATAYGGGEGVNVLPVSIELNPKAWKLSGKIGERNIAKITIHPVMETKSFKGEGGKERMMKEAQDLVYSVGALKELRASLKEE